MRFTVENMDAMLTFLQDEAAYLRKNHKGLFWADSKAAKLDTVAELVRTVRQDQQMAGLGGKRIG